MLIASNWAWWSKVIELKSLLISTIIANETYFCHISIRHGIIYGDKITYYYSLTYYKDNCSIFYIVVNEQSTLSDLPNYSFWMWFGSFIVIVWDIQVFYHGGS